MRQWVFIILPIIFIVLFFVIDSLIFSSEYSYMSTSRSQPYKLEDELPSSPHPSARNTVNEDDSIISKNNESAFISKNKKVFTGDHNSTKDPRQDMVSTSSYSASSDPAVQTRSAPLTLPPGDEDTEVSFIMGASPSIFFSLDFINEQVLEHDLLFKNISVGGLSALTYNPEKKIFLALSDDKGNKRDSPRFYKLKLNKKEEGKKYTLELMDQVFLKNQIGQTFKPIDPEGVAFFKPDHIFISSEGAQLPHLTVSPGIFVFSSQGKWRASWSIPDIYWSDDSSQRGVWGVKENKAFEALAINPEQNQLWLATESSLHQDDLIGIDVSDRQYIRISRFDIETAQMNAQFIYEMDSYIEINNFTGNNGLTDFLSLGDKKLLVVERAYLKDSSISGDRKTDANLVRLFLTDCSGASDVSEYKKLDTGRIVTCGKTLVADLSSVLGDEVDNIEGITIGPEVSSGRYLLVLVSDNNFSRTQKTQFLFFHYSLDGKF